jgi:hypothetical protein
LTGYLSHEEALPAVTPLQRGKALLVTAQVLLRLHLLRLRRDAAKEWQYVHRCLDMPHNRMLLEHLSPEKLFRFLRHELLWCQLVTQCIMPHALCLERSLAFCVYLQTLGVPAQMVIGRNLFGKLDEYPFHAWVEVAGIVGNDIAEVQTGYAVVERIP